MPIQMKTQLKLVLVMLFWGATFVSGRLLAQNYHPFAIGFMRFVVAIVFLFPIMAFNKQENFRLTLPQLLKVIVLGSTGIFAYNYFFFAGLKTVEAGKASLIIATNPAITAFLAGVILKEAFSYQKTLGAIFALIGAMVVISNGNISHLMDIGLGQGETYLFFAVICWVTYTILGKFALKDLSPLKATSYACLMGTIIYFPFAYNNGLMQLIDQITVNEFMHLFYLGFFATVLGFIWFYQGIQAIGASKGAVFINLVPLFGVLSGYIFLGEQIHFSLILAGAIILLGVALVQKSKS